jgi:PKD repeat protein
MKMAVYPKNRSLFPLHQPWISGWKESPEGCTPLAVKFGNIDVEDIELYNWDFGDGLQSSHKSPTHIYTNDGTTDLSFNVTLKVVSSEGCENEGVLRNAVTVHPIPTIDFNFGEDDCRSE